MSQDAMTRLPAPVRDLVLAATKGNPAMFGSSEKDVAEVEKWVGKAAREGELGVAGIEALDSHLVSRTFLVSNYLTAADVAVYGALHPTISKETSAQHYAHPSVTRYFAHVQTRPQVRSAADAANPPFPIVAIDIENAPKPVRAAEPAKKEKAPKAAAEGAPAAAVAETEEKKAGKKEKKEKEPREKKAEVGDASAKRTGGKGGAPAAVEPMGPVPSMIDLRVGHIVDVQKHPDADGLYVEQIDIGEETGPRTVVSGLVNYIPIEQMRNKRLIAVCNLKPANMRGVKSFAMVLCATHKVGKDAGIEIVDPPKDAKPGDRVYFEGPYENDKPLDQLNPKKKIFETIQPGFTTLDSREAAWVDPVTKSVHRLRTQSGVCTAPSFVGASLS